MKTILEKREFIRSAKVEAKDDFLFELIHDNERLLSRFEEFVKSFNPGANHMRRELNVVTFEEELQQVYEACKEGLEELNFENPDWGKWQQIQGEHLDDNEIAKEIAKNEALDFFEAWRIDIMTEISSGYHFQGLAIIVGMVAATAEAKIHDPNHHLGDLPNEFFMELLNIELEKLLKSSFEISPIDNSDILYLSESIFQFSRNSTIALLKHLAPLFESMVNSPELAKSIIKSLDENSIPLQIVPKLADLLTTKTGDEQVWLKMAESVFPDDFDLAVKLLDYYYQRIPEDFEQMALIAFNHHHLALSDYLDGKMKEGSPLFCRHLLARAGAELSMFLYEQARKFITRDEGIAFAKDHPGFDFKLGIFKKEKAWEEILLLASSKQAADQLHELLPPIMKYFPDDCLTILESNAAHSYRHFRNREGYSKLVGFLKLGQEIPEKTEEMKQLTDHYIKISHRLPALKDELRSHGFIA